MARLLDFPVMSIGVEAVISHRDSFGLPKLLSACPFIEREAFQGKQRPDHVLAHALGLGLCLGPDAAVDRESRMALGEGAVRPSGTEELLMD
jgi:hypothetical protein